VRFTLPGYDENIPYKSSGYLVLSGCRMDVREIDEVYLRLKNTRLVAGMHTGIMKTPFRRTPRDIPAIYY